MAEQPVEIMPQMTDLNISDQAPWYELTCVTEREGIMPPISEVCFDSNHEMLWMGYSNGYIASLSWPTLGRYSSFSAHVEDDVSHTGGGIRQLLVNETGVISLSSRKLRVHGRGGVLQLQFTRERMRGMHALSFLGTSKSTVVMGGETDKMYIFDISALRLVDEVSVSENISTIEATDTEMWIGAIDGSLCRRDPRTMQLENRLDLVFPGGVASLDISDNYLVACGYTKRMGQTFHDQWIKIFDTRTMTTLPSVAFNSAISVKFMPHTHNIVIGSQEGMFRTYNVDASPSAVENICPSYSVETGGAELLSCDVSDNGQWMAFGDANGVVHQWLHNQHEEAFPPASFSSVPIVHGAPLHPTPATNPIVSDDASLGSLYTAPPSGDGLQLLSTWPEQMPTRVPKPVTPLDRDLVDSLTWHDFVGYAPNPQTRRRNQVTDEKDKRKTPAQFESPAVQPHRLPYDTKQKLRPTPPRSHRRLTVKQSGLAAQIFNFDQYNKTHFSGLENVLSNSYVNSAIQVLYFLPQLRMMMLNHLCERERCLSCELGLLFRMLDSQTMLCEARNFIKVFRQIREAQALGLWEPDDAFNQTSVFLPRMVESLVRFLLELLHKELSVAPPGSKATGGVPGVYKSKNLEANSFIDPLIIERLFGGKQLHETKCLTCGATTRREGQLFHLDLQIGSQLAKKHDLPFVELLHAEYGSARSTSAYCEPCKAYRLTEDRRLILEPPHVLFVTSGLQKKEDIDIWKSIRASGDATKNPANAPPSFVPETLSLKQVSERIIGTKKDIKSWKVVTKDGEKGRKWNLSAVVAHVTEAGATGESRHLVAYIRVPHEYYERHGIPEDKRSDWVLFNDFHVTKSSTVHATLFNSAWEVPCVCLYTEEGFMDIIPPRQSRDPITQAVLWSTPLCGSPPFSFVPLTKSTIIETGTKVALDAEFVALSAPEMEEGTYGPEMIKRARLGLGRVSVVRTDNDANAEEGTPFIDDYIHSSEPIVDYLTRFSGLVQGDLDYRVSPHHVVTLKQICAKLRFLVDRGIVFVGHGLKQDFSVINISVPADQIIDTVVLFHKKNQRMVGLRFLAWFLLEIVIQSEVHDSIEDARTAWAVYKEYLRLKEEDKFEETLDRLYEVGRERDWQIQEVM